MLSIINEPGLYSLVLSSRKPEAKALCNMYVFLLFVCAIILLVFKNGLLFYYI